MGQKHLTIHQKREIIEDLLGKNPSGVLLLVSATAQRQADWRAAKDKNARKRTPFLTDYVQEKLKLYWSPEQISGHLQQEFPNEPAKHISFKSIYRWICKDTRKPEKKTAQGLYPLPSP